ncbi:MAG: Nitrilotriacetate monooxygenase component B, partial [uncultured Thermomicrobiales bacterium]
ERFPLLRARIRPRFDARSVQGHCRPTPDRVGLHAERRRDSQPRAVQLLQRGGRHAADDRLFLQWPQRQPHQCRDDRRVRLEHGHPCPGGGDERVLRCRIARDRRVHARRARGRSQPHCCATARRGEPGVARMPSAADREVARSRRPADRQSTCDRPGGRRPHPPDLSSRRHLRHRCGTPDHARRLPRRLCRGDSGNDVQDDPAWHI